MIDILEGRPLPTPRPPRVPEVRPISGRLARVNAYVLMSFAAAIGTGPPPDFARSLPFIALARAACRDPEPGRAGPALERIDELLAAAEQRARRRPEQARAPPRAGDGRRRDRRNRAGRHTRVKRGRGDEAERGGRKTGGSGVVEGSHQFSLACGRADERTTAFVVRRLAPRLCGRCGGTGQA